MFKYLHAADIHLDSPLHGLERYEGAPVDEIRSATRRAFNNLIDLAINEAVSFVLLAGDLYDGDWKDYNTGLYFVECMNRLDKAAIKVFIVAGNHDAASQITKHLRLPDNVTLFKTHKPEKVIIEELSVAIYGQGFSTRAITEDLSLSYPQGDPHLFNIGLLHTCLDGKPGHEPYAPCSVDGLRSKGYQYWALGHIHRREIISKEPWIVFPGNIQGRHSRETGAKGCTLVRVDNTDIIHVEHHDLDVMRWFQCELDITDIASIDDIYALVEESLQQTLDHAGGRSVAIRLIIKGSSAAHVQLTLERDYWLQEYRSLCNRLGGAGIWLEKLSLKTTQALSSEDILVREDALGGLLETISSLDVDDSYLDELAEEMKSLRQKLPHEILTGNDSYDPQDTEVLKDALNDVKELLVHQLLSDEHES